MVRTDWRHICWFEDARELVAWFVDADECVGSSRKFFAILMVCRV